MNYERLYENLISSRKKLGIPEGYKEKHHIIPKSFGGSDEDENLVLMTAREHFIAHRILAKIYPNSGMIHAVFKMACSNKTMKRYKVSGRVYEKLRKDHAHRVSIDENSKLKKSLSTKGRKQTPEHIKARTESRKNNGEWLSEETKKKIGVGNKGKVGTWKGKSIPKSSIEKRKMSMTQNKGWVWTEERKEAQRNRLLGKPSKKPPLSESDKNKLREEKCKTIKCPHCDKEGQLLVMKRWHFDNCKNLTKL